MAMSMVEARISMVQQSEDLPPSDLLTEMVKAHCELKLGQ